MAEFNISSTSRTIQEYYRQLNTYAALGRKSEGTVRNAFENVLEACGRKLNLVLINEWGFKPAGRTHALSVDGAMVDPVFKLPHGYWEAKDSTDRLDEEIAKKFDRGYPQDNIIFQEPNRAVLIQDGQRVLDADLKKPEELVRSLREFLAYGRVRHSDWQSAVREFGAAIPELARNVLALIEQERREYAPFRDAFLRFATTAREAINPALSDIAVEEMLVQHLLTGRILGSVFGATDFVRRNVVAREIENVIDTLAGRHFSRDEMLRPLDRFYLAIEETAGTIADFSRKQEFLNSVYERFFQGFSTKTADTLGIVYTPQPIVKFMISGVEQLLRNDLGRSLADPGVHIIDPFTGTGNFLVNVMQQLPGTALRRKYGDALTGKRPELHANEIMLLPYYVASMNIEHAYAERTGAWRPFEGICLTDTFDTVDDRQTNLFAEGNSARVEQQKRAPITVVIGNPPYNAWQQSENDNNRNRKHGAVDERVAATYKKRSRATLKIALNDPYVKAFRWASDKVETNGEGIVAFVTNNGYLDGTAFDGMRQSLAEEFDTLYLLDLGGNVRKNPKLSGTTHNVFGIQVGVTIAFLVRSKTAKQRGRILYAALPEMARRTEKLRTLAEAASLDSIDWQEITPDGRGNWLTEGEAPEFETFVPIGSKEAKRGEGEAIFESFSAGLKTNRDAWVYNSTPAAVGENVQRMIDSYNTELFRYRATGRGRSVEDVVTSDSSKISWSGDLKVALARGKTTEFDEQKIRRALYRPFTKQWVYFDRLLNNSVYQLPRLFPTADSTNRVIIVTGVGAEKTFAPFISAILPDLAFYGGGSSVQCFPLYTYNPDGKRRENIAAWGREAMRAPGMNSDPTAEEVFHYIYAVLHSPAYRERYGRNLRRELPRIPPAPDAETFRAMVEAGRQLGELHLGYENAEEYPLEQQQTGEAPISPRVERMKLSKDKRSIAVNSTLTLSGIPPEVFEYRLGNRSALEWVIDQQGISVDKRSGIVNDTNDPGDPWQTVRLVRQVITVSLETTRIVQGMPRVVPRA